MPMISYLVPSWSKTNLIIRGTRLVRVYPKLGLTQAEQDRCDQCDTHADYLDPEEGDLYCCSHALEYWAHEQRQPRD